jgi:hypothetical protein
MDPLETSMDSDFSIDPSVLLAVGLFTVPLMCIGSSLISIITGITRLASSLEPVVSNTIPIAPSITVGTAILPIGPSVGWAETVASLVLFCAVFAIFSVAYLCSLSAHVDRNSSRGVECKEPVSRFSSANETVLGSSMQRSQWTDQWVEISVDSAKR